MRYCQQGYRSSTLIVENQMEDQTENEMETAGVGFRDANPIMEKHVRRKQLVFVQALNRQP